MTWCGDGMRNWVESWSIHVYDSYLSDVRSGERPATFAQESTSSSAAAARQNSGSQRTGVGVRLLRVVLGGSCVATMKRLGRVA